MLTYRLKSTSGRYREGRSFGGRCLGRHQGVAPLQRRAQRGQRREPQAAVRGHHARLRTAPPPLRLEVARQLAEDRAKPQGLPRDVVRKSEHIEALPDLPSFHRGDPLNHYMRVASEPVFCIWSNRYSTPQNKICALGQWTERHGVYAVRRLVLNEDCRSRHSRNVGTARRYISLLVSPLPFTPIGVCDGIHESLIFLGIRTVSDCIHSANSFALDIENKPVFVVIGP